MTVNGSITPEYTRDGFQKLAIPTDGLAVTPNNTVQLPGNGPLYVGGGGTLVVVMREGTTGALTGATLTFTNVASGQFLPINVSYVISTGTTCTNILQLY